MNFPITKTRIAPGPNSKRSDSASLAFSLADLCVLLAVIIILFTFALLPAIAHPHASSQAVQCLANLRQLINAWTMYAEDNHGKLASNDAVGFGSTALNWVGGNMLTDPTNTIVLTNGGYALLGPYIAGVRPFKCPADTHLSPIVGGAANPVRSVSMNSHVGVSAPSRFGTGTFISFTNLPSLTSPADLFVILDEDETSISDASFAIDPSSPGQFLDIPGLRHESAGGFSFADGHSEMHRWFDASSFLVVNPLIVNVGNPDILWLQQHSITNR